jgi:hypothetical protein
MMAGSLMVSDSLERLNVKQPRIESGAWKTTKNENGAEKFLNAG